MTSQFQPLFHRLFQLAANNQHVVVATLASALVGIPVLRIVIIDYREYLAIGPGGVPHNLVGWLLQLFLRPFKKEPLHTSCYDDARTVAQAGPNGNVAFLSEDHVPLRNLPRPKVGGWTLPSRQVTDFAPEDMKARYQSFLVSLASASPSQLKIATSLGERRGPALFVASEGPSHPIAKKARGEIAHMHGTDGSMHVSLAPKDAKLVLERGWGERHPFSGRGLYIGLVMVYAPRGEQELEVVQQITRAGARFMLGEEA